MSTPNVSLLYHSRYSYVSRGSKERNPYVWRRDAKSWASLSPLTRVLELGSAVALERLQRLVGRVHLAHLHGGHGQAVARLLEQNLHAWGHNGCGEGIGAAVVL